MLRPVLLKLQQSRRLRSAEELPGSSAVRGWFLREKGRRGGLEGGAVCGDGTEGGAVGGDGAEGGAVGRDESEGGEVQIAAPSGVHCIMYYTNCSCVLYFHQYKATLLTFVQQDPESK